MSNVVTNSLSSIGV